MKESRLVWVLVLGCIIAATAHAQWYEGTWTFPDTMGSLDGVYYVVPNPLTGRVYVGDGYGVAAFDAASRQKVWRTDFEGEPFYCPGIDRVYVIGDSALVIDAHTDSVMGIAELFGWRPDVVAYSSVSRKMYAPLGDTGSTQVIAVVDLAADSVVARVHGWQFVPSMAWDSSTNRLFVGHYDSSRVGVIDCEADTVIAWVSLSGNPSWLAVSAASHRVFAGTESGTIDIIDVDSLRLVGTIIQSSETPVLVSPITDRLYVRNEDTLVIIDCATGTLRAQVARDSYASALCASTLSGRVYVGDRDSPFITVIDTNDVTSDSIALAPDDNSEALAFSPGRNELYVGTSDGLAVVIDAQADTVVGAVDYNAPSFSGLTFNPAGSKLYALSSTPDKLLVISSDGQATRTLPIRASATTTTCLDHEMNRLYMVESQWLRVVDCNTDSVVRELAVQDIDKGLLVQSSVSKLYIFPRSSTQPGLLRVYDCYRDTVVRNVYVGDDVPCAAYLPVTNRVYFAERGPSFLYALDVERDMIVDSIFVGRVSTYGRLLVDVRRGLLYVLADGADSLCIVDARQDSVLLGLPIPTGLDTMFLSEASNKLYLSNRSSDGPTYVFDLGLGTIVDTIPFGPARIGMMDGRNNKLYFGSSAAMTVIDCRYDSVVAVLPSGGSTIRGMAWDPVHNRVFAGGGPTISVYQDDPYAVEEGVVGETRFGLALLANPVRGSARFRCTVPAGEKARLVVRDVLGRQVAAMDVRGGDAPVSVTWSGADARGQRMAAGVYLAQLVAGTDRATVKVVLE